jgi:hypothetical protein
MMRGAAGEQCDLADVAEREGQFGQINGLAGRVDQRLQRVADHRRLLEDLLLHEVAVIALADQCARQRRLAHFPLNWSIGAVVDRNLLRGKPGPDLAGALVKARSR